MNYKNIYFTVDSNSLRIFNFQPIILIHQILRLTKKFFVMKISSIMLKTKIVSPIVIVRKQL